jgi:putative PIN family toxin of toxin-antitoxin system
VRAVFDTNIVVSALVFGGRLAWLRHAWAHRTTVPLVCRHTTAELLRVLAYPKFRLSAADRTSLLEDFLPYAEILELPSVLSEIPIQCRDPDDAVFLHLAMTAGAPLVSGDSDLSALRGLLPIEVLTIREWRERLEALHAGA